MTEVRDRRILIVDDEPHICEILSRWLSDEGYSCTSAYDGETALKFLERENFHLLISDIMMPGMSGIDLLTVTRPTYPDLAVLMVTAVDDRKTAVRTLQLGAYGYVIKPFDRNEILINVANALERRDITRLSHEYEQNLTEHVRKRIAEVRIQEEEFVFRLTSAIGRRTDETPGHIRRMGLYSSALLKAYLGWDAKEVDDIRIAAAVHDVGKLGIPDSIVLKPGKLTAEEFEIMKKHAEIGAHIMEQSNFKVVEVSREIALCHHERWDGSGYPQGLRGEAIPDSARVVAVADVYDSLISDRVYRPAFPENKALAMIKEEKGGHFDPRIVECFFDCLLEIQHIRQEVEEEAFWGDLW
jgi:putative two-component system response regulator